MKYKRFVVFIFILMIFLFIYLFSNRYIKVSSDADKKVLIEHSYLSTSGSFIYKGVVLFDDGTIYSWNTTDEINFSKLTTMKDKSLWIIKNGNKSKKRLGRNKINEIKKYIDRLDDSSTTTEFKSTKNGITTIKIWDYNDSKYFILKETGDYESFNDSKESKKIIKITNKYLKIKE